MFNLKSLLDFRSVRITTQADEIKEREYYKNLFVENPLWNATEPNDDESSRWKEIQGLIESKFRHGENISILDVGCGRGWLSKKLSAYGSVVGIEPVESVVEHAKKIFPGISFCALKPEQFLKTYPSKRFDLLVCSEVIEHVIEKNQFLQALNNLLKEDGFLIITTPRGELRKKWEADHGVPPQPIEEWVSTRELKSLLQSAEFRVIESRTAFTSDIYQIHLAQKAR